jgi:hypothetical protein
MINMHAANSANTLIKLQFLGLGGRNRDYHLRQRIPLHPIIILKFLGLGGRNRDYHIRQRIPLQQTYSEVSSTQPPTTNGKDANKIFPNSKQNTHYVHIFLHKQKRYIPLLATWSVDDFYNKFRLNSSYVGRLDPPTTTTSGKSVEKTADQLDHDKAVFDFFFKMAGKVSA